MYQKILVPIDGSDVSLLAAKYARELAEKFHSTVTLVYIVQNSADMAQVAPISPSIIEALDADSKLVLSKAMDVFHGFNGKVSTQLEYGHPGRQITKIAMENNYSLIIMGRRGLNNVTELLFGSVSRYVLQHAPCPTMIIHH